MCIEHYHINVLKSKELFQYSKCSKQQTIHDLSSQGRYRTYIVSNMENKANLRDLKAATGLLILLKLDLNRWFFSLSDLEIWWMTSKYNRAPLLYYIKLCASFQIIGELKKLQSGNAQFRSKSAIFCPVLTFKFDGWTSGIIGHLFYATSSCVYHLIAIGEFKLELQSRNAQFGSKSTIFWAMLSRNLSNDLEKQLGTSPEQHQALCIISSSYLNSN